jgi:Ca2+-binding RTX toxin-like protein
MLELINAERAKVGAQPLAFDANLLSAAEQHSLWMLSSDTFSHVGSGGSSATQRMQAAGYQFVGSWTAAENIAWATTQGPTGFQDDVLLLHQNLMNSPGHRTNLLNASFKEIGLGFETGDYQGRESAFVTENFAKSGSGSVLTGVAFRDGDGDRFYDAGEGLGGLAVKAVSSVGKTYSTTTMATGGYQVDLPAGSYTLTFSGGGIATTTRKATIGTANVKLDLLNPATSPSETASAQISGTSANNTLTGRTGADTILALGGDDLLYGLAGHDRLDGGPGNDRMAGSTGNDYLIGRAGRDFLNGGAGNDRLYGGPDPDLFYFRGRWGFDRILDFQNGVDTLDLRSNGLTFAKLKISRADVDKDGALDDVLIQATDRSIGLLNTKAALIEKGDFLF